MNIMFIDIVEIITCLLIVGKIFQITRLYRQSNERYQQNKKQLTKRSSNISMHSKAINTNSVYHRFKENHSQHNLPLPDVSFTEGSPLSEALFSSNVGSRIKQQSQHKTILNNYIDDFFFESPPQVFHEAEVVQFKDYKIDSNAVDEFISIADEHAEMIRAFESLEKNVCFVR